MLNIFRSVVYFGNKIKLRRLYFNFASYALDQENIPMKEAQRLESIMENVKFGPNFFCKDEVLSALNALRFPGYESFYANQMHGDSQQQLEFMAVAIPRVGKYRYLVIERKLNSSYTVISDFIAPMWPIVRVERKDDTLEFLSRTNEVILVRNRI